MQFMEAEKKLTYVIHLKALLLTWIIVCYQNLFTYFLSHNLLHMM